MAKLNFSKVKAIFSLVVALLEVLIDRLEVDSTNNTNSQPMAEQVISAPSGYENILPDITIRTWSDKHGTTSESQKNVQQAQLAQYQNAYDYMMWEKQNEYNSPASQMQRFAEAGLNPNLAYQMGNPGNATSAPESHGVELTPEMNKTEKTLKSIEAASEIIKALNDIVSTASESYATISSGNRTNTLLPYEANKSIQEIAMRRDERDYKYYDHLWTEFLRGTLQSNFGGTTSWQQALSDPDFGISKNQLSDLFENSPSFKDYDAGVKEQQWKAMQAEFDAKKSEYYYTKCLPEYLKKLQNANTYQEIINATFQLYKEMGMLGQFMSIFSHLLQYEKEKIISKVAEV